MAGAFETVTGHALEEHNYHFLLFVKKFILADRETAKTYLGMSEKMAAAIGNMEAEKLRKLAKLNQSICFLREDRLPQSA